ncbi:integral to membrane protein [Filobasidium floriforme]|uniref:integral to membrane protein n=1 Tax=Filobasidium floriforme TaxID=5210 RepID=UPI001E8E250D|nr:integral to membrane protein [Filobasidium floriforme]KAH8088115.1 integral to membrane protein [Filobasidium floriforme]
MPRSSFVNLSIGLLLLLGANAVNAQRSYCAEDPFANPSEDRCNPLRYIPVIWGAITALVLYFIVAILLTVQFFRYGGKYFLCLVIGCYCYGIGLCMRIPFRSDPHNTTIYIVQYLFIVLSPCAFLAGDYILLGRIVSHLSGDRHLRPVRPNKVTLFFVLSDVATFLIQAAGGGLSISQKPAMRDAGQKIFLAGICLQLASFAFFTCLWALFGIRAYKRDPELWGMAWWKPLYWALGFTCAMFLIRSVFRAVELSEGYTGYLATHEIYIYLLDTLPLFLGVTTYIYFWPARYLRADTKVIKDEQDMSSVDHAATPIPDLTQTGERPVEAVQEVKK